MKEGERSNTPYDDNFVCGNESDKRMIWPHNDRFVNIGRKPKFVARTSQNQSIKFSLPDDTMVGYHQPSADAREIISN